MLVIRTPFSIYCQMKLLSMDYTEKLFSSFVGKSIPLSFRDHLNQDFQEKFGSPDIWVSWGLRSYSINITT